MTKNKKGIHEIIYKTVLCGVMIAMGLLLPLITGQIPEIGAMLLPMHLPVMLTGLILGWQWGMAVGGITPLLRSVIFSVPVLFPTAISMSFELCAYGAVTGILFFVFRTILSMRGFRTLGAVYLSLIPAMILGRCVFGISQCILLGVGEGGYTLYAFLSATVLNAVPGIIIQLILIPAIILAMEKCRCLPRGRREKPQSCGTRLPRALAAEYILAAAKTGQRAERPFVIAIEGRCCSGKTSLAKEIEGLLPKGACTVIHMDDFFLRPEQMSEERLAEVGGGFDRERLRSEVLLPISRGKSFIYSPYDCKTGSVTKGSTVFPAPTVILEGSYSSHPSISGFADLLVYIDIDPVTQRRRVLSREGEAGAEVFLSRWIPREERYFEKYRPWERANLIVEVPEEDKNIK